MILEWLKLSLMLVLSGVILGALASALLDHVWRAKLRIADPTLKSRLAFLLSAMPWLVSGLLLFGAFGPSLLHLSGVLVDHCGSHGDHHPFHLCFLHGNPLALGHWVWVGGALLMFRLLSHTLVVARKVSRTRGLGQNLLRLARYDEATDVWYIESARVFAFTVGFISPKVCISTKADEVLDRDQRQVVLDHEHQHARSRDALRLLLVELLGAFHLPRTHRHLVSEFELAREQICDDAAAGVEDRLLVAETILVVSRLQRHEPQPPFALAFGQREVEQRVRVLLEHPARRGGRRAFASVLLVSSVLFLGLHAHIHHALEALLATLH